MIDREKLAFAIEVKRGKNSLAVVAEETGINVASLSRFENQKQEPDRDSLYKLCKWMGVPMETFFTDDELQPAA